jgi:hypothetical protein
MNVVRCWSSVGLSARHGSDAETPRVKSPTTILSAHGAGADT